jgi:5-methylcytosine-specific restriction endonuclease McrA
VTACVDCNRTKDNRTPERRGSLLKHAGGRRGWRLHVTVLRVTVRVASGRRPRGVTSCTGTRSWSRDRSAGGRGGRLFGRGHLRAVATVGVRFRRHFAVFCGWRFRRNPRDRYLPRRWRAVLMGDPCVLCGLPADGLDHIVPAAGGGSDGWANRAPLCFRCDQMKASAPLVVVLLMLKRAHGRTDRRVRYRIEGIRAQATRNICATMLRRWKIGVQTEVIGRRTSARMRRKGRRQERRHEQASAVQGEAPASDGQILQAVGGWQRRVAGATTDAGSARGAGEGVGDRP